VISLLDTNKKGKNNGKRKGKIKSVKWYWGQEQQVARERLIEVLTSPPILAYAITVYRFC
jgi:hypothetical protein